jgi:acyl-CoA thioesterase
MSNGGGGASFEFDRGTALEALGGGRFAGRISRDFWIQVGPNGGYLAAIALRGAVLALSDATRAPRSMHVRYLSPPKEGDFELKTAVVRAGKSMTTLDVSLQQAGRECMTAGFCFSVAFGGPSFQGRAPPMALPLAESPPLPKGAPMNQRFDSRVAIGGPPRNGDRAETGGYMRFVDGRPIDMLALAAMWDCWPPAVLYRATEPGFSGGLPTVEATVYFRRQLPFRNFRPNDPVLLHTRSAMAHEGFVEEDADIWSLQGELLLQSRQLAVAVSR